MNAQSLRIALLVRAFPTVSETFIRDQLTGLRQAGHTVDVFSLYTGHTAGRRGRVATAPGTRYLIGRELPLSAALRRAAGRLVRARTSPGALGRLGRLAIRHPREAAEAVHAMPVLRRVDPHYDVIHAHFGPTGLLAALLRKALLLSGALVTTFHGFDLTRYPTSRGPRAYADLFRLGERFTVNSGFMEERARALGAPAKRLHRLAVGVDVEQIEYAPRSRPDGRLRLLTVGRLEEVKGIRFGLAAVARLARDGLDVGYTVVGGGRLAEELAAEAARLGVAERVRFTGPLPSDAVLRELGEHHLFLLPGIHTTDGQVEAQGRVLIEAQAAGMPVVASRVGGIPETLARGAGLLVPPGDVGALAAGIRGILERSDEWPEMGRRGRAHVEENYDQRVLLDRLVEIYRLAMLESDGAAGDG